MQAKITGTRVRTLPQPDDVHRNSGRRILEPARCPGCGRLIGKERLKWSVIMLLENNSDLTPRERVKIIRAVFPEDTPAPVSRKGERQHAEACVSR